MQVTERQIYNVTELKTMIEGFEKLFGCAPDVRIKVIGPHGGSTGTRDQHSGELVFFPYNGMTLVRAGRKFAQVRSDDNELYQIALDDAEVIVKAAFHLP